MHPAKAFCHAALRQRCPPGPVKAVGPTGVHLRILYPKLVLQIISALCRVFSLIASRGFESRIIHTRSYTGGRIIAQPGLNSVVGNELMKKKKKNKSKPNHRDSVFAPVARWREYGQRETSGLPGSGCLFLWRLACAILHGINAWTGTTVATGKTALPFPQGPEKVRKNGSFRGQPVVGLWRASVSATIEGAWLSQLGSKLDDGKTSPTVGFLKRRDPASASPLTN